MMVRKARGGGVGVRGVRRVRRVRKMGVRG